MFERRFVASRPLHTVVAFEKARQAILALGGILLSYFLHFGDGAEVSLNHALGHLAVEDIRIIRILARSIGALELLVLRIHS